MGPADVRPCVDGSDVNMLIFFTAALSTLLALLQSRAKFLLRLTAAPRLDRWHSVPTPSSGGIAIFLSCAAAYWLTCPGRYSRITLAVAALWILGFIDDRVGLSPKPKLAVEALFALFVALGGAVSPLTNSYPTDVALSVFWIVMITNAFNLIDNMDGLCAGVVVVICLSRFLLLNSAGYGTDATIWAILGASFGGFLILNHHPARIFMGDCGSLPAGFALAALTLSGPVPHTGGFLVRFFCPAITFAYPIFDTALVSILRMLTGRPISLGGCDHSSHRLVSLGLNQRKAVWSLWLVAACGASLGSLIYWGPTVLFPAGGLFVALLAIFGASLARLPGYPRTEWRRLSGTQMDA